ncbi:thioesterase family protein [Streptomyces sp. NPDC037389]|uniref:thioesterase family protein n=1 Tax=Streptomyces sp. NPDC037389 TaxID=3155369 RepID=UPI0034010CE1
MAPATIGDSEFDRDTAISANGPGGGYDVHLHPGWTVFGPLNGGYLLALLARALRDTLSHPDPFTVTAHYLSASRPGPAVIRAEPLRTGRSLSTGQARLLQRAEDGTETERVRVLAAYGDLAALPDDVRTIATPPPLPPYEQCRGLLDLGPAPAVPIPELVHRLDYRLDPATMGWMTGRPSGRGEIRAWYGLADGRAPDPLSLLLAVDSLPPTAFEYGVTGVVPTVELTAHIRTRPAPGPLRIVKTSRNLAGGYMEEDAEVWDSRDRLVAQSRQLARPSL